MAGYSIRDADTAEAEEIVALWIAAGASPSPTDTAADVAAMIRRPDGAVLVAEDGGTIVGTVIGAFDGWRANIYRLAVHPDHRRLGIARGLVRAVERRLTALGAKRISALVESDHRWAVAFWESVGYSRQQNMVRYLKSE